MDKELHRMQLLAGIITEGQYLQIIENTEEENDIYKRPSNPPNLKMVINDYNSRKVELKSMGKERNKYSQSFAKWAKTQIKDLNFGSLTNLDIELSKLFGISKYSRFPLPDGKINNFLPIDVLENWKSNNDPKYIGLLVYIGRILDPESKIY